MVPGESKDARRSRPRNEGLPGHLGGGSFSPWTNSPSLGRITSGLDPMVTSGDQMVYQEAWGDQA